MNARTEHHSGQGQIQGQDQGHCQDHIPPEQVPITRDTMSRLLGFHVHKIELFERAFRHISACRHCKTDSYERLEFLGDRVLNFVIGKYLSDAFPDKDEGFLSRMTAKLVSGKCLSYLASQLDLGKFVVMKRTVGAGFTTNARILEDVYEALLGAIYESEGLAVAKAFILATMEKFIDLDRLMIEDNYKDAIMRFTHSRSLPLPVYEVMNDPHVTKEGMFDIRVQLEGCFGRGQASTRKSAEQLAAMRLLLAMGLVAPNGHALVLNKNQIQTPGAR